jgi:hypothetical protein
MLKMYLVAHKDDASLHSRRAGGRFLSPKSHHASSHVTTDAKGIDAATSESEERAAWEEKLSKLRIDCNLCLVKEADYELPKLVRRGTMLASVAVEV